MKWWNCILKFFRYERTHYKDHRDTREYELRTRVVKTWWVWFGIAVIVLLQFPNTWGMIVVGLLALTFASFAFLDEWKHFRKDCDDDDE